MDCLLRTGKRRDKGLKHCGCAPWCWKPFFSPPEAVHQPLKCYPKQDEVDVVKMRLAEVLTITLEDTSVIVVGFMQHFSAQIEPMKHKVTTWFKKFQVIAHVFFFACLFDVVWFHINALNANSCYSLAQVILQSLPTHIFCSEHCLESPCHVSMSICFVQLDEPFAKNRLNVQWNGTEDAIGDAPDMWH